MKKRYCFSLTVIFLFLSACSFWGTDAAADAQRVALIVVRAGNIKNLCILPGQDAQVIYAQENEEALLYSLYGLHPKDCGGFCVYLPKRALQVDEVAVFTFENPEQLENIKLAVSRRLSGQMETFKGFDELYARLADARYGQCGKYYYLIIASKKSADAAEKKMLEYL